MNKRQRHLSKPTRTHMLHSVASSYYWGIYCATSNLDYNRGFLSARKIRIKWVVWQGIICLSQGAQAVLYCPPTDLGWALGLHAESFPAWVWLLLAAQGNSPACFSVCFSRMGSSFQARFSAQPSSCCANLVIHTMSKVSSELACQCI